MSIDTTRRARFEALRARSIHLAQRGEFAAALAACDEALEWAREHGEDEDVDLAFCNRAFVLCTIGRGAEASSELRRIVLGSSAPLNRHLAAYSISLNHLYGGRSEKSLFYARLALDYATQVEGVEARVHAHNHIANVLLTDSRFAQARRHYERSCELLTGSEGVDRALAFANLGYCHLVQGETKDGFRCLFLGLRMMRRLGLHRWETLSRVRLGLAYGYLGLGRYQRAIAHAGRTLAAAEQLGDAETIKIALYLLGEAEKQAGRQDDAYGRFVRLQREFHPEHDRLADLLMATEASQLVNLMA